MARRLGLFVCAVIAGAVGCRQSGNTAEHGVVLLRYNPGSESTEQREKGFLDTLAKEFPSVRVLSSDQYAGTTPESALDKATDVLNKYQDRVSGIFAVCEPNANGVLRALENTGLVGKVKCVVFDPGSGLIDGMAQGKVDGIVLQDPVKMGYEGVKTMVAHLDGTAVEKRIVTGEHVATPENMKDAEIKPLLEPAQFTEESAPPEKVKYRIAVIPKGTTHEFWKSVHAGRHRRRRKRATWRFCGRGRCWRMTPRGRSTWCRISLPRKSMES